MAETTDNPPASQHVEHRDGAAGDAVPTGAADPDAAADAAEAAAEAAADAAAAAGGAAMEVDQEGAPQAGASGFVQTNVPPLLSGPSRLDSTVQLLQSIVNKEIAKLDRGEIDELSPQTMDLMDRLVSVSSQSDSSVAPAAVQQNDPVPSLAKSFAEALSSKPKRVVLSSQDVKQVPRLTGSADTDVISCLQQFRLVCSFRVKAVAPAGMSEAELITAADEVAFEHVSLICDGLVLTLYQHIMEGRINWHQPSVDRDQSDSPGARPAPKNWSELKSALLDCLMPSNSVEEAAVSLAAFNMSVKETGAAYALRFQTECARFESAVERFSPGRSPYQVLLVVLFRNGFIPAVKVLAQQEQHPKTMTEAVAQLRRLEAANLTGTNTRRVNAHASATAFTHVPNRTAVAQQYSAVSLRAASGNAGDSTSGGSTSSTKPKPKASKAKGKGGSGTVPVCTHPTCVSKVGHDVSTCLTRLREESKEAQEKLQQLQRLSQQIKSGGNRKKKFKKNKTTSAVSAADEDDE